MTRWYSEKKKEHYYKEAKRQGYRARSAFKLQQMHRAFSLISQGDTILDLGAAPGGWSQVATALTGETGTVIGVDVLPIAPLERATFLQGDMTKEETMDALAQLLNGTSVDVVLSDMSPDISGNYSVDQARSVWLCEQALAVAHRFLKPGGHFLCKIFQGEDTAAFLKMVKSQFGTVKTSSPQASRKSSSEMYLIARSFQPKKV
ncbi:MAG: RlmE family RNA methyltransferase [Candidatus Thermoplasmatota archaeon]|nr:RlmE family RNA methyltransferase [Candidatus Thermoplasmatota archaeon]